MSSLFIELKRRNVFRVGAAYLVGGWILLQVSDALFPALNLPEWTTRFVVGLVVLGFPVALIMAWAFEVTPEGVKRDSGDSSVSESSSHRLNIATLIGVGIVIALVVWQRVDQPISQSQPASEITVTELAPSIAVLAFENMSPDPENAFFAEGISEEILNVLAGIDGLEVASRTSAFSFANSDTPIPEIASALSVNHVLEGSVRKQGVRVRITAQLIDASNDKHLWSDTYDRELDDIFVVQEEIAEAISAALLGALGMSQVKVDAPTKDLVAYELFLSGRSHFYQRGNKGLNRAITDLTAAVARDPEFAAAWSFLGAAHNTLLGYGSFDDDSIAEHTRLAGEAAEEALQLDPDQALAVAIQAQIRDEEDRVGGRVLMRQALEMAPDNAGLTMWLGSDYFKAGHLAKALPLFKRAVELDPLSGINNGTLGLGLLMAGERGKAREHLLRAFDLGWGGSTEMLYIDYMHTGEFDKAYGFRKRDIDRSKENLSADEYADYEMVARRMSENNITVEELLDLETALSQKYEYQVGFYSEYLLLGDIDRVIEMSLEIPSMFPHYPMRTAFGPAGRPMVEHPRFLEVGEHFGYLPIWEAEGYPLDCEMVEDDLGKHLSCPNWPE